MVALALALALALAVSSSSPELAPFKAELGTDRSCWILEDSISIEADADSSSILCCFDLQNPESKSI